MNSLLKFSSNKISTLLDDPFLKEKIKSVSIHMSLRECNTFGEFPKMKIKPKWWGYIKFINNNTEGCQNFKDKDSMEEIINEMKNFLEGIE